MSTIRSDLVHQTINRAWASFDYNTHGDLHTSYEYIRQVILTDSSLTEDEKTEAIRLNNKDYDRDKIRCNTGIRRICENCNQKCLATLHCEYCVQNYLKARFSNWTSGNNDIDNLIQKCQLVTLSPGMIVEWIPYDNLQNIKHLTKGGFSDIYTANWIDGYYIEWDTKKQQLIRFGTQFVVLKELVNVEGASQIWFEEAKSHLNISSKYPRIAKCYGLTKNPSNGNYLLVLNWKDINLREYLQRNNSQITWKERIQIVFSIIDALRWIHKENSIHRDLHSGNILYSQQADAWCISDLGFCGPADKSSKSIYGNLPYIAPEVISGRKYSFASDIYSIGILMWEISSGQLPFYNHEHDYNLAMNIVNGVRPRIVPGTPLEYENLIKQCWDADSLKRPNINTLLNKISEINASFQNISDESQANNNLNKSNLKINYTSKMLFTSKVHQFEKFPEPRNATEEEQEAFYSKSYDLNIPDNFDDSNSNYASTSKTSSKLKGFSKRLSKVFKPLNINSKNDK
ncbi:kinase-like domain-containing protein [Rhizophagus irregularis DAOM 181602=DAOM 197198]|uniref:Kinase-like domain-containing protein n=3 Tax=Rhizophagus irregularis TaxID=588596 RepID=A0A2H5TWN6_RHIID|nr:kinase-like domain-containing protein [Rhizophagus irregularis DAOM 181602=DAOM 197198]POG59158.1 kinase-like domain-containing protein [Rhizophagus irregularis DAOM 181602=DAOM 197198]|eukprot:XP_025166024.1 kinase-like domain-containing protein [Rhizophagus irregularis DAOM 181602=DAOM 197198]